MRLVRVVVPICRYAVSHARLEISKLTRSVIAITLLRIKDTSQSVRRRSLWAISNAELLAAQPHFLCLSY